MNYWIIAFPCLMYLASVGAYPNLLEAGINSLG